LNDLLHDVEEPEALTLFDLCVIAVKCAAVDDTAGHHQMR
jgi:hypothetical protein